MEPRSSIFLPLRMLVSGLLAVRKSHVGERGGLEKALLKKGNSLPLS